MRYTVTIIIFIALSFASFIPERSLKGTWSMQLIVINSDTAFLRSNQDLTIRHYLKVYKKIESYEDSIIAKKAAIEAYENIMSIQITFLTDSTFSMTKMKSGGRIFPNLTDTGTYSASNNTIFFNNPSRKNQMNLVIDEKNDRLCYRDGVPGHMVYWEYKKNNN